MITKRPLAIRLLPPRFKGSLYSRFYRRHRERWLHLYRNAELLAAPGITMQLVPGDLLSDSIAFTGDYELGLTRRVMSLARKGGTMIDIGANLGYFALLWASAHPSNHCIAFEASPRNVELLRQNVAQNGLGDRIRVVPCAAAAKAGKLFFDLGPEDQLGWGGISLDQNNGQVEVTAVRVDDLVNSDATISMLKVDTEGADAWALMGCEKLLRGRRVKEIWFEENKPRMEKLGIAANTAQDFLRSVGYACRSHNNPDSVLVEWSAVPMV